MSDTDGKVNGFPPGVGIQFGNPLVKMLEEVLAEVKAGRMTSVAIIGITPAGGVATPMIGDRMADMYMGAAMVQRHIMEQILNPPRRPAIIPARPLV